MQFDRDRFIDAARKFLAGAGMDGFPEPALDNLRLVYRAFTSLPYENVSKIIASSGESDSPGPDRATRHGPVSSPGKRFRTPETVLEDYMQSRLGGTCFSLTQTLYHLLLQCGFRARRVLGDMRHGRNIHCAVVADLPEGPFLCDAGYLLPSPVRLDPAGRSMLEGPLYTYHLDPEQVAEVSAPAYSMHTVSHSGQARWRYRIRDLAAGDSEFELHWLRSFDAPMNRQLVLSRGIDDTQVYVHQHKLRLTMPGTRENRNIRSRLGASVEELFGIDSRLVELAHERITKAREKTGRKP